MPGALGVQERDADEGDTDRDLDDIGDTPRDVVGGLVERHSVASPKGYKSAQLVAKL